HPRPAPAAVEDGQGRGAGPGPAAVRREPGAVADRHGREGPRRHHGRGHRREAAVPLRDRDRAGAGAAQGQDLPHRSPGLGGPARCAALLRRPRGRPVRAGLLPQAGRGRRRSAGGAPPTMKVLVPESLSEEGLDKLRTQTEVEARKLSRDELLEAIGDVDALIVRSATRVDKELLERASSLKVVGRAGVGLDNIDVAAATRLGILVVNAPTSNVLSAAEHTLSALLSLARHIPAAAASLRVGGWER